MPYSQLDLDRAENPLDIIERIAAHNHWSFDRDEEDEISISVAGGWSEYEIAFTCSPGGGIACCLRLRPQLGRAANGACLSRLAHQ